MTNNNNINQYEGWKPNLPQTATVSYYYPEEEVEIAPLVHQGVYQSEKAITSIGEPVDYGPGFSAGYGFANPDCWHNFCYKEGNEYYSFIKAENVDVARDWLRKMENKTITVVDRRKDKDIRKERFEKDVKDFIKEAISKYEETGDYNQSLYYHQIS